MTLFANDSSGPSWLGPDKNDLLLERKREQWAPQILTPLLCQTSGTFMSAACLKEGRGQPGPGTARPRNLFQLSALGVLVSFLLLVQRRLWVLFWF